MSKIKSLSAQDLRVQKSVRDIKRAMMELIAAKPYRSIRVDEIAQLAPVNKKTFYRYFSSKNDLLCSIRDDLVAEASEGLKTLQSGDLRGGGTRVLYICGHY